MSHFRQELRESFDQILVEAVQSQQKTITQLPEELKLFRRKLFGQSSERHAEDDSQLQLLIGDLSYSYNHDKAGRDSEAVWELCEHLEYAQRTGDGDLDIIW